VTSPAGAVMSTTSDFPTRRFDTVQHGGSAAFHSASRSPAAGSGVSGTMVFARFGNGSVSRGITRIDNGFSTSLNTVAFSILILAFVSGTPPSSRTPTSPAFSPKRSRSGSENRRFT